MVKMAPVTVWEGWAALLAFKTAAAGVARVEWAGMAEPVGWGFFWKVGRSPPVAVRSHSIATAAKAEPEAMAAAAAVGAEVWGLGAVAPVVGAARGERGGKG
ncbi:hypothetical protein VB712_04840 [Spirulina sp. CCNP1310]|nr:hypothetical protein [Spirulina sp. CCNP1310]